MLQGRFEMPDAAAAKPAAAPLICQHRHSTPSLFETLPDLAERHHGAVWHEGRGLPRVSGLRAQVRNPQPAKTRPRRCSACTGDCQHAREERAGRPSGALARRPTCAAGRRRRVLPGPCRSGRKLRTDAAVSDVYELGVTIGTGGFSKVKLATERATGEQYACKARAPAAVRAVVLAAACCGQCLLPLLRAVPTRLHPPP